MSHNTSDDEMIKNTRNTARFFVETRHISWVLLIATCIWGVYGYLNMPQRKDPEIPVRVAVALTPWPGSSAEKIENLVTRKIEGKIAENAKVTKIESISRTSVSVIYVEIDEKVKDTAAELDDIKLKLDSIRDLPQGAQPINFIKDFGDTAALLLTVASPKVSDVELELRARAVARAITSVRGGALGRATLVVAFPPSINARPLTRIAEEATRSLSDASSDARMIEGPGFLGVDLKTTLSD